MTLLLTLAAIQTGPAETFRQLCDRTDRAAALLVRIEGERTVDGASAKVTGLLRLRDASARLDLTVDRGGRPREQRIFVRDGLFHETDGGGAFDPEDAPPEAVPRMRAMVARAGLLGFTLLAASARQGRRLRGDLPDPARFECADFASGGEETIAGRRAVRLTYRIRMAGAVAEPFAVTLWLDAERGLPLRRSITAAVRGRPCAIQESYLQFEFDPEIPDADLTPPPNR